MSDYGCILSTCTQSLVVWCGADADSFREMGAIGHWFYSNFAGIGSVTGFLNLVTGLYELTV